MIESFFLNLFVLEIHRIYQFEGALILLTNSFLGIWVLMSEIYDIFKLEANTYFQDNKLHVVYNVFGIITIIPIIIILVTMHSTFGPVIFYVASALEIFIIITRFFSIYSNEFRDVVIFRERIVIGK